MKYSPKRIKGDTPDSYSFENPVEAQPVQQTWLVRLWGIVLLLFIVMMLLSLISYDVNEVGWPSLNHLATAESAAAPCTNFLGIPGLYTAATLYFLVGLAAWWLVPLLFYVVVRLICMPTESVTKQTICYTLILLCAPAAFAVQPWFFQTQVAELHLSNAGGLIGQYIGIEGLPPLIDDNITLCILLLIHSIAFIYFADCKISTVSRIIWRDSKSVLRFIFRIKASTPKKSVTKTVKESSVPVPAHLDELTYDDDFIPTEEEDILSDPYPPVSGSPESRIMEQMRLNEQRLNRQPSKQEPPVGRGMQRMPAEEKIKIEPTPTPKPAPVHIPAPAPKPAPILAPAPVKKNIMPSRPPSVAQNYIFPSYDILFYKPVSEEVTQAAKTEMANMQQIILDTLSAFGYSVEPGDITRGPSITRYEIYPAKGLRINKIVALRRDLMLATSSESINIIAPIPGKNSIGIELANEEKSPVYLRELLQDEKFMSKKFRIPVALGKDVYGDTVIGDLASMPHTLVAGTTGSGKSVCINSMIISMLYKFTPEQLQLILVDPKTVEMQPYLKVPHLAMPVVTEPARVIGALRWAVNEMEHRYRLFSRFGVRNFEDYNACDKSIIFDEEDEDDNWNSDAPIDYASIDAMASEIERQAEDEVALEEETQAELDFDAIDNPPESIPYIVIIIDELADLMMVVKEDLENYVARLTQKARAAGIHLVVATQTPRSNVVTGIIKANIPSRIAFKVSSPLDSRIILDMDGAENLLGKGDCLFMPPTGIVGLTRAQGAYVSDKEIQTVVAHCASQGKQKFNSAAMAELNNCDSASGGGGGGGGNGKAVSEGDMMGELYDRCVEMIIRERKASVSMIQRRFKIGYNRAADIMDTLEQRGVVSAPRGGKSERDILIDAPCPE